MGKDVMEDNLCIFYNRLTLGITDPSPPQSANERTDHPPMKPEPSWSSHLLSRLLTTAALGLTLSTLTFWGRHLDLTHSKQENSGLEVKYLM